MSTVCQQSRTGEIYGSISTLTVIGRRDLRLFTRKLSPASFWWDDWTLIIALVMLFDHGLSNRMYADKFSRFRTLAAPSVILLRLEIMK